MTTEGSRERTYRFPSRLFRESRKPGRLGWIESAQGWNTSCGFVSADLNAMAHAKIIKDTDVEDPCGVEAALQEVRARLDADEWEWTMRSPRAWAP